MSILLKSTTKYIYDVPEIKAKIILYVSVFSFFAPLLEKQRERECRPSGLERDLPVEVVEE
jgi:hypothetical protein